MRPSNRVLVTLLAFAVLLVPAIARAQDWPMYGRDLKHSFTNPGSLINAGNVGLLAPAWDFTTGDAVSASPAVVDGVVYVGSWDGFFYALDAASGTLMWSFQVDCQSTVQPIPAQCPGGPSAPQDRAQTDGGLITSSAAVVDGKPVRGPGQNRGCGGVWSSAAVDERKRLVFFGTADCGFDAPPPYHEAMLALRAGSLKVSWAFRPRQGDICDFDFGASPNILDVGANQWVGEGGKDGTYYVLKRVTPNRGGELVWRANVVFGGFSGGFIGSTAFDGQRVYGGTAFGELGNPNGVCNPSDPRDTVLQQPTMHAFDPAARTVAWEESGAPALGASSVANGVVFVGTPAPPSLRAFDVQSGTLLRQIPLAGAVNSSAALVGDSLFVGSGDSESGAGGGVHALRLLSLR